jgi:glycosyltransferase involved in cell wall biosynthesis
MSKPLISIVIPFKNTDLYITECVESILKQSYGNWEAIFVDDNSTDRSYTIIEEFAKKDSRIKLFSNIGSGIIHALRTAYNQSSGEYITRMDSDDIMTTDRLETMVTSLIHFGKKHLAVGQVKYFRKDGVNDGFRKYEQWLNRLTKSGSNYSEIYKECVIPSPCWMIHREDFEQCGSFNSDLYPEDYDLVFRFYKQGLKCIPSTKLLHYWRDYNYRTSRTQANYSHDMMLELKLHYFLQLHHDKEKTLVIWGAGHKGKYAANYLLEHKVNFIWICDNPKKIGKHIYNQELHDFKYLESINKPQSIITVANPNAQKEIKAYLINQNMESMVDYFFFC